MMQYPSLKHYGFALGLLGIAWLVSFVDGNTPGNRLTDRGYRRGSWAWVNDTRTRSQDNFTCGQGQRCTFANITVNVSAWVGPNPPGAFYNNRRNVTLYALYSTYTNIYIQSEVELNCCNLPLFVELNKTMREKLINNCHKWNGTTLNLTLEDPKYFLCTNGTTIQNRTVWGDFLVFPNMDTAKIDPGQVKRLPSTCERVGQHAQKTELSFEISFPPAKKCKYRRAWYDTLLGGYGTLTGTLNGFDIETLANRLHNAGSKINDALTLQARWMPTVWAPLKLQAKIDDDLLDIINGSNIFTYNVDTNISRVVNWTICSLQTLQQQQQKGLFQTMLMTGNEEVWRTVFSSLVRTEHWLDIKAPKVMCNDTYCKGRLTLYNVTKSSIMCKYVVLPLLIGPKGDQHFWVPTFNGQVIDNDNRTHDLTFCDDTLEGKICKLQSAVYEPCLLQNTVNNCEWTIMPTSYRWMVEIAPQVICVVTDRPVVPKMRVPFAGCIHNITVLQWENETFMLKPDVQMTYRTHWESTRMDVPTWDLNLTKLHRLIEESQQVKDSIKHLNRSIIARQLSTTIVAGQIIKVGSAIADATSHHWWDVFMGYSPSAGTMMNWLVHPLLIVMAIVVILSIWNCYVAYGICCKKKKVVMVSYANGRH
ncbi:uncharacterized protein ACMZJ9_007287 [Mantella aurantiaca]